MKLLLALIAWLGMTLCCASSYYVSPSGADFNPGSLEMPFKTVYKGLSSLNPGDTLYLRKGEYRETLKSIPIRQGLSDKRIVFRNYPGEAPVIRGLLWLQRPSFWTLLGLRVTWLDGQSSRSHMVKMVNGTGWTIRNCEFWGSKSYANLLVAGTVPNEPRNWRVIHNKIHSVTKNNDTNQDHAIYLHTGLTSGKGWVERNLIHSVANGMGVKVSGSDPGEGTQNVTVRYNTIVNCTQPVLVGWESNNNSVYRNILMGAGPRYGAVRGFQLSGRNNVAFDNLWWDCQGGMVLNYDGGNGVTDAGGNVKQYPRLDSLFRPSAPLAYGRDAAP
jgi:hypothetical protein